jgi:hypothetical protein
VGTDISVDLINLGHVVCYPSMHSAAADRGAQTRYWVLAP